MCGHSACCRAATFMEFLPMNYATDPALSWSSHLMKFLLLALLVSQAHASHRNEDQLVRNLLRELIDIDTTHSTGSTGKAAEAMAAHLREAGFAPSEVQVLGPRPERANLVARL